MAYLYWRWSLAWVFSTTQHFLHSFCLPCCSAGMEAVSCDLIWGNTSSSELCLCVCVCVCVRACVHIYMHACVWVGPCACVCMHVCIRTLLFLCTYSNLWSESGQENIYNHQTHFLSMYTTPTHLITFVTPSSLIIYDFWGATYREHADTMTPVWFIVLQRVVV